MRNDALYRGRRKFDLYVPQRRPTQTIGKITAAMPGMDGDMWTLAQQTLSKLKRMTDSDYDSQKFYFTDENE